MNGVTIQVQVWRPCHPAAPLMAHNAGWPIFALWYYSGWVIGPVFCCKVESHAAQVSIQGIQ